VKGVLKRVFDILGGDGIQRSAHGGKLDPTDLIAVRRAAKQMSLNPHYRDIVVVVVELGSEFNVETGSYVRRQYLFYPFREAADYRRIVCLKAAYRNGIRIDTTPTENMPSQPIAQSPGRAAFDEPAPPTLVWGKPGRWAARGHEEHAFTRS
jgi:hypothetical protein